MNVTYSITEHNSVQVLSISSLLDEWQNRRILKELDRKINTQFNNLVIDLSQLKLVNSAGLNFLLSLFSKIKKRKGDLILANASKKVQQVLDITKLSTVFAIESSVEQAVENLELELVA